MHSRNLQNIHFEFKNAPNGKYVLNGKQIKIYVVQPNNLFIAQHLKIGYFFEKKYLRHQKIMEQNTDFSCQALGPHSFHFGSRVK